MMRKYAVEATGTFFLVFALGLTGNPLAIGLILAGMVYGGLHISGAHYNTAVSFAFLIQRKIDFNTFIGYFIAQLLGALAAAGLVYYLAEEVFYVEPPYSTNLYQQGIIEAVLSFVLVFVYLNLAMDTKRKSLRLNGLAIGLTYTAVIYAGEIISGGIFNPSVSFGTSIVDFIAIQGTSFEFIPLYTLAPLAGSTLAALAYSYFND
jgi:glycerol uptake facilitator-like aquaporin